MRALVAGGAGQLGRDLVRRARPRARVGGRAGRARHRRRRRHRRALPARAARRGVQRHRLQQGRRGGERGGASLRGQRARPEPPGPRGAGRGRPPRPLLDRLRVRRLRHPAVPRGRLPATPRGLRRLEAGGGASRGVRPRRVARDPHERASSAAAGTGRRAARSSSASSTRRARAGRCASSSDQTFSPTYSPDLAGAAVALVQAGARGLVHVTGGGACSWHELAVAALRLASIDAPVEPIRAADLNLAAARPRYSVLDNARYLGFGLPAAAALARAPSPRR